MTYLTRQTISFYGLLFSLAFAMALLIPTHLILVFLISTTAALVALLLTSPIIFFVAASLLYTTAKIPLASLTPTIKSLFSINSAQLLGLLLGVALTFRLILYLTTRHNIHLSHIFYWSLLLTISTILSLLLAPQPSIAYAPAGRLLTSLVAMWFTYHLAKSRRDLGALYAGILATSLITAISAVHNYFSGYIDPSLRTGAYRVGGIVGGWGSTAAVTLVGIPVTYHLYIRSKTLIVKYLSVAGFAILSLGLLATFRRASLLAILLYGIITVIQPNDMDLRLPAGRRFMLLLLAGGACVAVFLFADPVTIHARLSDIPGLGDRSLSDPSAGSGRIMIWTSIIHALWDNTWFSWIFGNGIMASFTATQRFVKAAFVAHNSYLELLYDQGLFGLMSYLALVVTILRRLSTIANSSSPLNLYALLWGRFFLVYSLTLAMFSSSIYSLASEIWMYAILGAIIGVGSVGDKHITHMAMPPREITPSGHQ